MPKNLLNSPQKLDRMTGKLCLTQPSVSDSERIEFLLGKHAGMLKNIWCGHVVQYAIPYAIQITGNAIFLNILWIVLLVS